MIKITNTADSSLIQIFGEIGETFWGEGWTLEKFNNQLKGVNVSNLTIELKSNGGDVFEAFAIYDTLKAMPARVTVKIIGASASAATIIASGADRIEISENSRYLVHNAMSFVDGNKEAMKDVYEQLESIDNQILDIYIKRTGKSREVLAELMKAEKWMNAEEALEWGFVDSIIKTKIENIMDEEKVLPQKEEVKNATPEELMEENEMLKAKIAELEGKLSEIEAEKAEELDKEVDGLVENAIKVGKIKAEAKASIKAFGLTDKNGLIAMIDSIQISSKKLSDVPKANGSKSTEITNKAEFYAAWKRGDFKGKVKEFENMYSKFYEDVSR